ncbi:MAG: DUF5069 domain-containing protein [Opitutae bacterium]|nr:DUF5069 domain-containing protein [Opitutae bacterium]
MASLNTPDLTQYPPRSPRVRLGGYVVLPRIIDKARAHHAGKLGEYKWNNPLDQRLFTFLGVTPEAFLAAVLAAKSDSEVLAWVNATAKKQAWEIAAWTQWMENLGPGDVRRHRMWADDITKHCPQRVDIQTLFDRLDMDDYVTFGGAA